MEGTCGFICPGMPLMRNQLRTHTRKIRYGDRAAERALESLIPGRTTVEAVERGCLLMLQGLCLLSWNWRVVTGVKNS
jgi:type III pantothenate kinase